MYVLMLKGIIDGNSLVLVEEHIFFPNITFMASADTSLLQIVSSLYVLWHFGSGVALQSPGDCLVHRMQPPRHCL